MYEVKRFGKVLGRILGHRDPDATKRAAEVRFGKGVTLAKVL